MALLWVNDGYRKRFDDKINAYENKLTSIKKQYSNGYSKVSQYGYSDKNVAAVNTYLEKRKKDIDRKITEVREIKGKVHAYADMVLEADRSVASVIHNDSYSLYSAKGVGPQSDSFTSRAWNKIQTTASDFVHEPVETIYRAIDWTKEYYQNHKYVFEVAGDILAIAGAFALIAVAGPGFIGIIALTGGLWALSKATFDICTDINAVGYWLSGDEASAEESSKRTLTHTVLDGADWLDARVGGKVFSTTASTILSGLETCVFVAKMVLIYENIRAVTNLKLRSDGKPLTSLDITGNGQSWDENMRNLKLIKWLGTKGHGPRLGSGFNITKLVFMTLGLKADHKADSWGEYISSVANSKNKEKIMKNYNDPSTIANNMIGSTETADYENKLFDIWWYLEEKNA